MLVFSPKKICQNVKFDHLDGQHKKIVKFIKKQHGGSTRSTGSKMHKFMDRQQYFALLLEALKVGES
jgi:hypothetical protein